MKPTRPFGLLQLPAKRLATRGNCSASARGRTSRGSESSQRWVAGEALDGLRLAPARPSRFIVRHHARRRSHVGVDVSAAIGVDSGPTTECFGR